MHFIPCVPKRAGIRYNESDSRYGLGTAGMPWGWMIMIKRIEEFPDYYVGDTGEVFSNKSGELKRMKLRIHNGWIYASLYWKRKKYGIAVHRLVAEAFIPNDDPTLEVNHKNRIRSNNRVENLEWMTHTDNVRYSRCRGLRVIHDDGRIEEFQGMEDFCKNNPPWNSSNIRKYIKLYKGYSKKHKIRFEYINQNH